MSKLEVLNRLIQVFCIRVAKCRQATVKSIKLNSVSSIDNSISVESKVEDVNVEWFWQIMYWPVPFTGWKKEFVFIKANKPKYYKFWPLSLYQKHVIVCIVAILLSTGTMVWTGFLAHKVWLQHPHLIENGTQNSNR